MTRDRWIHVWLRENRIQPSTLYRHMRLYSRLVALALVAALLATMGAPSRLHAQADRPGGTHLFITYRCSPENRVAFVQGLESDAIKRLDEWKRNGVLTEYTLVYNQFVDANTWDAMLVVTFESYAQTDRWRAIEKDYPGGLSQDLLKLASPHTSYLADLEMSAGAPGDRSKSIFLFIPYEYRIRGEYLGYIKTYGVPQFDGWLKANVISSYGIYLNQHATGKPWDVMLVFEYNGIDGLGARDRIKQKVREELASNPSWKLLAQTKHDFRTELEVVMAAAVQARK